MTKRWIVFSGLFFGAACVGSKDQEADSGGGRLVDADTSPEQRIRGASLLGRSIQVSRMSAAIRSFSGLGDKSLTARPAIGASGAKGVFRR